MLALVRVRQVRPGLVLAVVLIGQFMAVLDASIVNVAAPSIHASLRASGAGLQLVVAGYTITYAVLLVTGARLGDILGHRRVFLAGLVLFTLASLGCGLAGTASLLIALRFVQGAGAALMIPQVLSLIQRTHAGPARARAMSRYSAVLAGGAVVGQVVGGLLISANLFHSGWRPVFLVNVPIGVLLLVAGARALPHGQGEPGRTLDLAGRLPAHATFGAFRHVSAHAEAITFLALAGLGAVGVLLAIVHTIERHGATT